MKHTIYDRLLRRELGDESRYSKVRGIYGEIKWINDLDIVNELGGHSGCVNALSWSRSGRLLASGSDDQHVNIHSYLPDSCHSQFSLTTSISTGHTQNIFSVKFMPHSNDRTIVTGAGDAEVRIFDIEYSGRTSEPSAASTLSSESRRRGFNRIYNGVKYLSDGDTNAKVFRSHSDRVKRIVTESSPYFFLTCSEDGEVRQWDIRQPSSAYPPPQSFRRLRPSSADHSGPPPLISYKRYGLDLNTISCSPSQPHYVALGGAHLHCFLHDRRMLGRDRLAERGASLPHPDNWSDHDEAQFGQATHCVLKFAPNGQRRMRRTEGGHITACKISDANPNEIIVSWSGEWIYSFDLVRSQDASEETKESTTLSSKDSPSSRIKESKHRKRKRTKSGSLISQEGTERAGSRPRTESSPSLEPRQEISLRVQYENGQSEEIPIEAPRARSPLSEAREAILPESQRQSYRIARSTVKLRKSMFTLGSAKAHSEADPTGHANSFTSVLGFAASILPEMDEVIRTWRYPVNPLDVDIAFQNTLRRNRCSARRFVQATGTLARVLGGKLRTAGSSGVVTTREYFYSIQTPAFDSPEIPTHEQFGYDFLKAVLLWLDSGVGALIEGFSRSREHPRFPIPKNASIDAIDEILIPYLLRLASDEPIINIDASRFEVDENRVTFTTEKAAVLAFAQALKIPFADLSSAIIPATSAEGNSPSSRIHAQDRRTALKFWAFKVGRGVLMNAGKDVNFAFVDRCFGGLGRPDATVRAEERALRSRYEEIDPDEEEDVAESVTMVTAQIHPSATEEATPAPSSQSAAHDSEEHEDENEDDEAIPISALAYAAREPELAEDDDEEGDTDGDVFESDENDDDDDDDDEDEGETAQFIYRSAFERRRLKEKVEEHVPCSPHTRMYRGHCNVKTVKDVNFFGLNDEYVVSGSDSGHIFIWDKKTTQIVNILEGDGEVVNVVQGHPYEPMLAVSGIDHSIKIFSPDARARDNARQGIGVAQHDPSGFSSLSYGRLRRGPRQTGAASEPAVPRESSTDDSEDEEKVAPNGLPSRKRMHLEYQITSQNDAERRGGNREAFITRSMLHALAARIAERQSQAGHPGGEGEEEGRGPILISDDCTVM